MYGNPSSFALIARAASLLASTWANERSAEEEEEGVDDEDDEEDEEEGREDGSDVEEEEEEEAVVVDSAAAGAKAMLCLDIWKENEQVSNTKMQKPDYDVLVETEDGVISP